MQSMIRERLKLTPTKSVMIGVHGVAMTFDRAMLRAAESCDEDDMIRDALLGTAHGTLYRRIQALREEIPEGFEVGVYNFDPDSREGDPPTL